MVHARWRLVALLAALAALPHAAAASRPDLPRDGTPRRGPLRDDTLQRNLRNENTLHGDITPRRDIQNDENLHRDDPPRRDLLPPQDEPPRRPQDLPLDGAAAPETTDYDDADEINITEKGMYVGSPCELACHPRLHHVLCNPAGGRCECDSKHPVLLAPAEGCAKPKKLGEMCFYRQTCEAYDQHASCIQLNHNARCECVPGYHSVTYSRPVQRVFCTQDMALLAADLPTLLGVATGIFVLAGLLCMVLHLYTRARYPHHPAHLADAAVTPPCLYSLNDTGGTVSMGGRPGSRSSTRSAATGGTLDSGGSRRESRARGVPVSASRAGAARAAAILLISCHLRAVRRDGGAHPSKCAAQGSRRPSMSSMQSSTSSVRSYSTRRFEKEREQKEKRQQMQMRLAQLHANMAGGREARDIPKHAPTPSPRSPNNSTDGLLPVVCEIRELASLEQGAVGPCSSSSLY